MFVLFHVAIVLSVLRYTVSDYPFWYFPYSVHFVGWNIHGNEQWWFMNAIPLFLDLSVTKKIGRQLFKKSLKDTKRLIRCLKSRDRQFNGQKKKDKKIINGRDNTTRNFSVIWGMAPKLSCTKSSGDKSGNIWVF